MAAKKLPSQKEGPKASWLHAPGYGLPTGRVFAVRPLIVFGLWEKHFASKSTRWVF